MKPNENGRFGTWPFSPTLLPPPPRKANYFLVILHSIFGVLLLFTAHGDKQDKVIQKAFVEPYFKNNGR